MKQDDDDDQRVRKLIGEIIKLFPKRSKIKTDLLYFKYAPILVYNPQNEMLSWCKTKCCFCKTKRI